MIVKHYPGVGSTSRTLALHILSARHMAGGSVCPETVGLGSREHHTTVNDAVLSPPDPCDDQCSLRGKSRTAQRYTARACGTRPLGGVLYPAGTSGDNG